MEPGKYKTVSTYTTGLAPSPDHLPPVCQNKGGGPEDLVTYSDIR